MEGCDKTGKSTLARFLSERLSMPIHKVSAPKGNPFVEYVDLLFDTKVPTIFDRFHIGEKVYGPLKRGKSDLDFRKMAAIEMVMSGLQTFNIYAEGPEKLIAKRFDEDGETFLSKEEIPQVLDLYDENIKKSMLLWHHYHIGDDMDKMLEIAQWFLPKDLKEKRKWLSYRTVGNYEQAKYLFVGEGYGPNWQNNPPLIPFGNNDPGLWLYSALDKLGILKDSLITNAEKKHKMGTSNENAFIDEASLKDIEVIVPLGNNALNKIVSWLKSHDIEKKVVLINHPAWATRKGITINQYASIIKSKLGI